MTTTITKRADELKPGDILASVGNGARLLVTRARSGTVTALRVVDIDINDGDGRHVEFQRHKQLDVEAPALSPAQQHAEELLELARDMLDGEVMQASLKVRANTLISKIDPPQPPTLEEALTALNILRKAGSAAGWEEREAADAILDRARRAKIVP